MATNWGKGSFISHYLQALGIHPKWLRLVEFSSFFYEGLALAYVLSEVASLGFLNHQTAVKILPQQLQHAPLQLQQVDPSTLEDPGSTTTPRKFPFFSKTGFQRHPFNFNMRSVSKPAGVSDRMYTPIASPWDWYMYLGLVDFFKW